MITLNSHPINITIFPDKTSQVWKLSPECIASISNINTIHWKFEGEAELIHILQLVDIISSYRHFSRIDLVCPYLPYARQHKKVSNDTTFALETFCNIIDGRIDRLCVFDVHNLDFFESNGNSRWHFSVENIAPEKEINNIITAKNIDLVVFPDESAQHRYSCLIEIPSVFASKVREQLTGEITGMEMPEITSGRNVLVVDDIIDGGATPISVASVIMKYKPSILIGFFSHGIFSKGTKIVYDAGYNEIYTKDGMDLSNPFN